MTDDQHTPTGEELAAIIRSQRASNQHTPTSHIIHRLGWHELARQVARREPATTTPAQDASPSPVTATRPP